MLRMPAQGCIRSFQRALWHSSSCGDEDLDTQCAFCIMEALAIPLQIIAGVEWCWESPAWCRGLCVRKASVSTLQVRGRAWEYTAIGSSKLNFAHFHMQLVRHRYGHPFGCCLPIRDNGIGTTSCMITCSFQVPFVVLRLARLMAAELHCPQRFP